jgi:predicted TIM-barrel fold metal-dependent hydrolase
MAANPARFQCLCRGGVACPGTATPADVARLKGRLVDVHHHVVPPFYLAENRQRIAGSPSRAVSPAWLEWSPHKSVEAMDEHGVATAMVSLSTPGLWFGDKDEARSTARRFNEYAMALAATYPGRFGLFSAIPLPDIEGSLREIEYALDVLKADGVGLLSSYDDRWLGDPLFQPVFQELDRRGSVVFVHPTTPNCCQDLIPTVSPLMAEAIQDTTRTVISLLFSGTLSRYRNIKFIFSHAGGSVPVVAARMTLYAPNDIAAILPDGVDYELQKLYFDIAVSGHRPAIAALASLVPMSQILFGSDFPYRALVESAGTLGNLGLSVEDLLAISRENAVRLFPRLAQPPLPSVAPFTPQ